MTALLARSPGTMLGLAARANRRAQRTNCPRPRRERVAEVARLVLAAVALTIGLTGFSMSSAQAFPWDEMKENITATIVNMCGPNDVPNQASYTNIDTIAGLNQAESHEGYRSTIKPDFTQDQSGGQGGNGMERLQKVYGDKGDVIAKPTYERYGFSTLQWHQYGYDCFSPSLMMGPLANTALMSMVHVPMMISMAVLNIVMDDALYTGFSDLMQPFIGAMYEIFQPWIYLLVPLGIGVTWLGSKGSLQATMKSVGWGVFVLSVYLLMGSSTSKVVSWATNIVTEVSGSAACKMNAADDGGRTDSTGCDADDAVKAVQQALWYGIPYQTWHLGQVGEYQAALDDEALEKGEVGWGPALLNGQYVGVDESGAVDESGRDVLAATQAWNSGTYSPEGDGTKNQLWGKDNQWDQVPYLANVKIMCDDRDNGDDEPGDDDNAMRRWIYSGATGSSKCDSAGAGTSAMVPHIQGDEYNKQILIAMSGLVGVIAVSLTIVVAAVYLGFQKMMFFFLLFLAPVVLLVSAIGDRKRRPFAVRYAEIVGANLLKQVAAVCIVLFVSYAMASLFGSTAFGAVPWIMKPYVALLFFAALAFLAFPLKNMVKGAIQGDTSVVDKQATAPQRAMKSTAKVAAVGAAAIATGGAGLAAVGGVSGIVPAVAAAGGRGVVMGEAGSMLGQAGRVMGIGSKSGRAMRAGGQLLKAGQGMMHAKDNMKGRQLGAFNAAAKMIRDNPSKYRRFNPETGAYDDATPEAKQQAMRDAQGMAERGAGHLRQGKSLDQFMREWDADYDGPDPKMPPQSGPDDKPKPLPKPEPRPLPPGGGTRQTAPGAGATLEGGATSGEDPSPEGPPSSDAPSAGAPATAPAHSAPADAEGAAAHRGPPQNYARYAEQAKENLSGPTFSHEMEYKVNTVRSSDDVLNHAGLSKEQVVDNPTLLLSSDHAYNGGSTTAMDPFNAATPALNELRFAGSSGNEDAIQSAVEKASELIHQHGVPNQIDGVHSIGDRAGSFDPVALVGAMPTLTESMTWQERAEAAYTMQAAQVALPEDAPALVREGTRDFTDFLSRPSSGIEDLTTLRDDLIADIDWGMRTDGKVWDATPGMAGGNGLSVDDLRDAIADGFRSTRLENEAAGTPSVSTSDVSSTAAPDTRSAASSEVAPSASTGNSAPVEEDAVDEVDDTDALVYRPGRDRRKKRSSFFLHEDTTDEEI